MRFDKNGNIIWEDVKDDYQKLEEAAVQVMIKEGLPIVKIIYHNHPTKHIGGRCYMNRRQDKDYY